jgi:hypothetical protein
MRSLALLRGMAIALTLAGCDTQPKAPTYTDRRPALAPLESSAAPAPEDWASQIGRPVLARNGAQSRGEVKIEAATIADPDYASRELVPVRRLVYRVTLILPEALAPQRQLVHVPAGELHVDVGEERVRARFVGPGWPVDEGSEVRLRADVPGVYLFDGDGGRPIGPGALASWFMGQAGLRARTEIDLRRDEAPPDEGPGTLLCALFAEWSQQSRDDLLPRCNPLPPAFRFGPWSGELTALVPATLPRSQLRADAVGLPAPPSTADSRALLDAGELARIAPTPPTPVRRGAEPAAPPPTAAAAVSGAALQVDNTSSTRVALLVQGIPVGWLKPQAHGEFDGMPPGQYRIASLRPNGQLIGAPLLLQLPARLTIGAKQLDSVQLSEPLLISPEAAR